MQSQWPLHDKSKYGITTYNQSDDINKVVGTEISFWGCVGGLIALWVLFRTLTVVSLTLQDK
jgi:hypothetical protein